MKTYLCIGGPKDGELVACEGESFAAVIYEEPLATARAEAKVRWTYVHYDLVKMRGDREMFHFWALRNMSGDDLIRQLIANYRPKVDA